MPNRSPVLLYSATISACSRMGIHAVIALKRAPAWDEPFQEYVCQMIKKVALFVGSLMGLLWCLNVAAQYAVQDIPNPKAQGQDYFVSDPDGNLSAGTRAELNDISIGIEKHNDSEFAIVVVNDYEGSDDFSFAMDLFAHWGIGKQGSNNGLLLFMSMDRREYRFITGYGLEGIFPDALLNQIALTYLVPYMKDGNTDMALLATAKAVESVFLSPTNELEFAQLQGYQPTFWNRHAAALEQSLLIMGLFAVAYVWMTQARKRVLKKFNLKVKAYKSPAFWYAFFTYLLLIFVSGFVILFSETHEQVYRMRNLPWFVAVFGALVLVYHYYGNRQLLKKSTKDSKMGLDMQVAYARSTLLPLLLTPFAYMAYFELNKQRKLASRRATPPNVPGEWTRVHRDTLKPAKLNTYLTELQQREEKLGAKSYEIWQAQGSEQFQLMDFAGDRSSDYTICPKCQGKTLKAPEIKVRQRATETATGTGERMQSCAFCDYTVSLGMVVLAKLSDSSSSGGSSGGGGSSSGGSFGGGSSGGGGAGGRW